MQSIKNTGIYSNLIRLKFNKACLKAFHMKGRGFELKNAHKYGVV